MKLKLILEEILNINDEKYVIDKNIWYHSTPSGDLIGGKYGLHVGTFLAAKQAIEARIGARADGKIWDGTLKYGKTKLAGKNTLKKIGVYETGFNAGPRLPENDFYAKEYWIKASFSNKDLVLEHMKPNILKVQIIGKMKNTINNPVSDEKAHKLINLSIKNNLGLGFYYINDGEDSGSISAVVPNKNHIKIIQ